MFSKDFLYRVIKSQDYLHLRKLRIPRITNKVELVSLACEDGLFGEELTLPLLMTTQEAFVDNVDQRSDCTDDL